MTEQHAAPAYTTEKEHAPQQQGAFPPAQAQTAAPTQHSHDQHAQEQYGGEREFSQGLFGCSAGGCLMSWW